MFCLFYPTKGEELESTTHRGNVPKNDPTRPESSMGSRPKAPLRPQASRNRSYPTPQAGNIRLHLVNPSLACASSVPSPLGDVWLSYLCQVIHSPERKEFWPETIRSRQKAAPSRPEYTLLPPRVIILLAERRALPPARRMVVEMKLRS